MYSLTHDHDALQAKHCAGYFRIACTLCAFTLATTKPSLFLSAYVLGFAFDAVDGLAARHYDQVTKFGAVLDMVTDRCSTVGLLGILCRMSPTYCVVWIVLMALDLSAHWFQVYASLAAGRSSHKVQLCTLNLRAVIAIHRSMIRLHVLFAGCGSDKLIGAVVLQQPSLHGVLLYISGSHLAMHLHDVS